MFAFNFIVHSSLQLRLGPQEGSCHQPISKPASAPASAPPYLRPTQFFWRALISKHTESQIFPPKRSRRGTEDLPRASPVENEITPTPGIVRPVNFLSPQSRSRLAFLLPSFTLTTATQVPTFKLPSA